MGAYRLAEEKEEQSSTGLAKGLEEERLRVSYITELCFITH